MKRFSEVTAGMARKVERSMAGLAGARSLVELEELFIPEAARLVPGDCLCWNNWSNDLSHQISVSSNDDYARKAGDLNDSFVETLIHHPLFTHFADTTDHVMRISDFASDRSFRENPLFREVYRHLDSYHQICYTPSVLPDHRIVLTWNRRALDFTERDRQIFHHLGQRLNVVALGIEERQRLEKHISELCRFVDSKIFPDPSSASLGEKDTLLLSQLLNHRSRGDIAGDSGIRRDSVDKRLGSIREKLGLENHHQLLSALADLKRK
jgi:DNA-binding CsgD family transcriptional regulator